MKQNLDVEELYISCKDKLNPDFYGAPLNDHENYFDLLVKTTASYI